MTVRGEPLNGTVFARIHRFMGCGSCMLPGRQRPPIVSATRVDFPDPDTPHIRQACLVVYHAFPFRLFARACRTVSLSCGFLRSRDSSPVLRAASIPCAFRPELLFQESSCHNPATT